MSKLTPVDAGQTKRTEADELVELGQWYWITDTAGWDGQIDGLKKGDTYKWLGCVMEIGSNYIKFHSQAKERGSYSTARVHLDEYWKRLELVENADEVIAGKIAFYRSELNGLLGQLKDLTAKLGVAPTTGIEDMNGATGNNALAVMSSQVDTEAYKRELTVAKTETLPAIHEEIKRTTERMQGWMLAVSLPLQATMTPMNQTVERIDDRIYTLGLYAGLAEQAVKCCDGDPAASHEKLRVMQRRLYMDEECLLNYQAGGMEMKNIREFDNWISQPENRDRLLPFPRTIVGFRVRRFEKDRSDTDISAYAQVMLDRDDKFTYFYIRNGEQVWRIAADFEFDEMLFPERTQFDPSVPMMANLSTNKLITVEAWKVMKAEELVRKRKYDEWDEANPDKSWIHNPYHNGVGFSFDYKNYRPFDHTNVYFDDLMKKVSDEIKRYNRIAVIIQGLLDRSLVLHPHPPITLWSAEGFERGIELIYDSMTLTHGDPPDFEAYRAELNASIGHDSIVTGQQEYWLLAMGVKETARRRADYRLSERERYRTWKRYKPDGDPGPGLVGPITTWKPRSRSATFRWEAELQDWKRFSDGTKPKTITVPVDKLLNVSAYKPGDYKRFLSDPRTRLEYLQWAPLLMAAEDYHGGKVNEKARAKGYYHWD